MASRTEPYARRPRNLGFAGFAQEFLRRNPDYAADFAESEAKIKDDAATSAPEVMARRWGLCFSLLA